QGHGRAFYRASVVASHRRTRTRMLFSADAQAGSRVPPVTDPTIELKRARRDELSDVQRLAGIIWRAHYPGIITHAQIDYMLERGYALPVLEGLLSGHDRGLELAMVDGEIAGFAAWYMTEDRAAAKLDKLYVLQSRQRLGLGGRLIARVAEL